MGAAADDNRCRSAYEPCATIRRAMPSVRRFASKQNYNAVLDAMAEFRSVHYGWAQEYINQWTDDPRGTGGTPYMKWLKQLIDETLAFKID